MSVDFSVSQYLAWWLLGFMHWLNVNATELGDPTRIIAPDSHGFADIDTGWWIQVTELSGMQKNSRGMQYKALVQVSVFTVVSPNASTYKPFEHQEHVGKVQHLLYTKRLPVYTYSNGSAVDSGRIASVAVTDVQRPQVEDKNDGRFLSHTALTVQIGFGGLTTGQ